ncbi:MAG: DUF371 domain-containing protein [Candidatus Altiarchaeota archaeon]|nr:DUF371 domain-containing protein [Candidatus Altiarchaeota archaeon]
MTERISALGHRNVSARHETTFEVTKEKHLTPRGDCIISVSADKAFPELSEEFKKTLRGDDTVLEITISCAGLSEKVIAHGSCDLQLSHPTDLVVRRSSFICERTLAIRADKAAIDFNRELVKSLSENNPVEIELRILD